MSYSLSELNKDISLAYCCCTSGVKDLLTKECPTLLLEATPCPTSSRRYWAFFQVTYSVTDQTIDIKSATANCRGGELWSFISVRNSDLVRFLCDLHVYMYLEGEEEDPSSTQEHWITSVQRPGTRSRCSSFGRGH